jgi:hypothetical protein
MARKAEVRQIERTAYHEAGHAVAAIAERRGIKTVSIEPTAEYMGRVQMVKADLPDDLGVGHGGPVSPRTELWVGRELRIDLAGPLAERRFVGRYNRAGAGGDHANVVNLGSCLHHGETLDRYIAYMRERTRAFIEHPLQWVRVEAIAEELLARRTITGTRARELYRRAIAERADRLRALLTEMRSTA